MKSLCGNQIEKTAMDYGQSNLEDHLAEAPCVTEDKVLPHEYFIKDTFLLFSFSNTIFT